MESRLAAADLQKAADTLVIALACAGDDSAFGELMRRRQTRVRKFMYHLCRQTALGDDLAQQVFLKAWRSLGRLRSALAFDGWLKKIMVSQLFILFLFAMNILFIRLILIFRAQ